jgi:hypothetical protein
VLAALWIDAIAVEGVVREIAQQALWSLGNAIPSAEGIVAWVEPGLYKRRNEAWHR